MTSSPESAAIRRLFLAVPLDEPVHAAVADLLLRLQKGVHFTPARPVWVPPENLHVTLHFLGDVPAGKADKLKETMASAVADLPGFDLDIRRLDEFPGPRLGPPKVLWIGVHQPPKALSHLRTALGDVLRRAQIPVPDHDFTPHITLARLKSTKGMIEFRNVVRTYQFTKCGRAKIRHVHLMESLTGGGPARYVSIASAPLADVVQKESAKE